MRRMKTLKEAPVIYVNKSKVGETEWRTYHKLDEYGEKLKFCYFEKGCESETFEVLYA